MTPPNPKTTNTRIRIGVSACLLGDEVRYDGGHKRNAFLTDTLGPLVEWVKVCPEVESGMSTPREPIRLVDENGTIRLRSVKTGVDHTASMTTYADARVAALAAEDLCGYILKKDSPSCGMTRVKVYGGEGSAVEVGVGIFAQALLTRFRIFRSRKRDVSTIRACARTSSSACSPTAGFAICSSRAGPSATWCGFTRRTNSLCWRTRRRRTRAWAAWSPGRSRLTAPRYAREYTAGFMDALTKIATPKRHTNVLQHMAGYFKKTLDAHRAPNCTAAIEDYRLGLVPLVVPVTLLRHHVRVHDVEYLSRQVYLAPHPKELMLRNHV